MNTVKYEVYANIRNQINELELQKRELEQEIIEEIKDLEAPLKLEVGTFSKVVSKKYTFPVGTYSKELIDRGIKAEDEIKQVKLLEKEAENKAIVEGKAESTETTSMRWIAPKK